MGTSARDYVTGDLFDLLDPDEPSPSDPLTDEEVRRWAAVIILGGCMELGDHAGEPPALELYHFFHSDWIDWLLSLLPGMPSGDRIWESLCGAHVRAKSGKYRFQLDRLRHIVQVYQARTLEDAYTFRARTHKDARVRAEKVV